MPRKKPDADYMFQSTPPSEERSDKLARNSGEIEIVVSIHAPLRREERHEEDSTSPLWGWFQSTPPSEERSDTGLTLPLYPQKCFNPRPPPKRGATAQRSWCIH